MNVINFPIGDWSGDGHEKCEYFRVECNKTVEEIELLHDRIKDVTGINLGTLCSSYEDNIVPAHVVEQLKELGIEIEGDEDSEGEGIVIYPEDMIEIWLKLLTLVDPADPFVFTILEDNVPTLCKSVGYGLFY